MNALNPTSSLTETATRGGFVPEIRSDATIEELDEWIIALGGREISPEEAQEWRNKINWSQIPGETVPI
jgi:hypothetical protein